MCLKSHARGIALFAGGQNAGDVGHGRAQYRRRGAEADYFPGSRGLATLCPLRETDGVSEHVGLPGHVFLVPPFQEERFWEISVARRITRPAHNMMVTEIRLFFGFVGKAQIES
jgi:hypothetical protein